MFIFTPDNVSMLISILGFGISVISLYRTSRHYKKNQALIERQIKNIDNSFAPNPHVQKLMYSKSNIDAKELKDANYCRIAVNIPVNLIPTLSLGNKIKVFKSTDISDGQIAAFISECMKRKECVYLTYLEDTPHICFNHARDNNLPFIIEYSNVIIDFHNYGADASAFKLNSMKVTLNDGNVIERFGPPNNIISITPEQNKSFSLIFDEIVENVDDSICKISEETYSNFPDNKGKPKNLLYYRLVGEVIRYNKIELDCTFYNNYNTPYDYILSLENNSDYFITKTIRK